MIDRGCVNDSGCLITLFVFLTYEAAKKCEGLTLFTQTDMAGYYYRLVSHAEYYLSFSSAERFLFILLIDLYLAV